MTFIKEKSLNLSQKQQTIKTLTNFTNFRVTDCKLFMSNMANKHVCENNGIACKIRGYILFPVA
jgi:hypothetical protein